MKTNVANRRAKIAGKGSFFGFLTCVVVCATIAYIASLYLAPGGKQPRRLWVPVVVETNGNQIALGETRQIEFWTPSLATKDFLRKNGSEIDAREQWQIVTNGDALVQFGSTLHSNDNVFGFRRIEVWGQGRTSFKPGWWWTMSVTTNYSVAQFAEIYQKFWKTSQAVRVEVIDNRGSTEK